jgi:hypothetical protein
MSVDKNNSKEADIITVAIPEVLTTICNELRLLSDGVNDLQELVSNLVVAGAFGASRSIYELQSMDRISQSLDAIADYLNGVSKLASPEWKIDAAEAARCVKLAELGDRLTGVKREDTSPNNAGDFDDFALTG